jgi:Cu+-exporting ATPase
MNFGFAYGHWQLVIMVGFLFQWPTLPTLIMFPVLAYVYVRLAKREEKEAEAILGGAYLEHARQVPRFVPRWGRSTVVCRPSDPERLSS